MKIKKAVFPAAGLGTRFLPATKALPKEMLALVDKPLIQYVVEEAVASDIPHIIIVTGRGKNAIEDHFDVSYELEKTLEKRGKTQMLSKVRAISDMIDVCYVRQKEALGLGHAILQVRHLIGDEPFAVFLGDDIIDSAVPCMKQMMDAYDRCHGAVLAIQEVEHRDVSSYGIVKVNSSDGRLHHIDDMVEKPSAASAPSNLAIIGRYILPPAIFDILEKTQPDINGEIQLTNGLKQLLREPGVYGYQFEGKRFDAGDKLGFLKATVEFALKNQDLGPAFKKYLSTLDLSIYQ